MDKAFDLKGLVLLLKDKGLDIAEDAAMLVVESVFEWTEKSVILTPTKYDDLTLAVMPIIKKMVLEQVDKIDGKIEL